MIIKAIDPSYTRTGVAIVEVTEPGIKVLAYTSIKVTDKSVYDLSMTLKMAEQLATQIIEFGSDYKIDNYAIEYPVLATHSGAYLGLIQQALYSKWGKAPVYMLPAQAINSYTKAKSKTDIVNYVKANFQELSSKINHDEASAIVLACILNSHLKGLYKNTVKVLKKVGR